MKARMGDIYAACKACSVLAAVIGIAAVCASWQILRGKAR